jgi:hypothetical protein
LEGSSMLLITALALARNRRLRRSKKPIVRYGVTKTGAMLGG